MNNDASAHEISPDRPSEEQPWYKNGLRFACKQCGRCCRGEPGYVWVTAGEIERLAKRLGYTPFQFERSFVRTIRPGLKSLIELDGGDCILCDEQSDGCFAYEDRPIQCKTWPFWRRNIESPNAWKKVARFCPGCNQGPLHPLEEIERAAAEIEL